MAFDNVSETAQEERDTPRGPRHAPVSAYRPPVDLADFAPFLDGQPYDVFEEMRRKAPVCWHPEPEGQGAGFWALTRHEDIRRVVLDTETFSSQRGGIMMNYGYPDQRHPLLHRASLDTMICLDQPHHMPLRREHMPFFTPGYIAKLREWVDQKVTALLDEMERQGPVVDMVELFSAELPLFTLCEMLGVDPADRPKLVKWMHYLELAGHAMRGGEQISEQFLTEFLSNVQEMFDFGQAALRARREAPREDLLSAIAHARIDGEPLSDEFLDGSWLLIVFAGNDTTRNSLSGTMRLLTAFPEEKAKLLAAPERIPNMVHEAIRMVSPVIYMRRTATREARIAEQAIGEGEKVVMYYGAANRDPSVFPDPDRFDVERSNAKDHIAFGIGPHVCLGQRVANMQLEAAYRQILARFPDIRWTGRQTIAPNNFVHAISSLEIDLGTPR